MVCKHHAAAQKFHALVTSAVCHLRSASSSVNLTPLISKSTRSTHLVAMNQTLLQDLWLRRHVHAIETVTATYCSSQELATKSFAPDKVQHAQTRTTIELQSKCCLKALNPCQAALIQCVRQIVVLETVCSILWHFDCCSLQT